ncbi:SDR family oxidoreductase [Aliikangiella sp. IMCC44653]
MNYIYRILFLIIIEAVGSSNLLANNSFPDAATKDKAILVTGASSGIGRNITETLASQGYLVFAGARKDQDIVALNQIKNVTALKLDVTSQNDIDSAVAIVEQSGYGLYGLVNNAGVALFEPLIEVAEKDLAFQMDVNLYGPYRMTKAFAPLLIKTQGKVINISSVAGIATGSMFGPYSMSKFGLEAYSEALAPEMAKFNVSVSLIEPGNYNSKVMSNLKKRHAKIEQKAKGSLFKAEYKKISKFIQPDRSHHKAPDEVSSAVLLVLESEKPLLRYMVVPNKREAVYPIKKTIAKLVELNHSQAYRFEREQLIQWLDAELSKLESSKGPSLTSKVTVSHQTAQQKAQ